ncbi:bifunctional UDP-N-acetylglucosamine diphosphorylase/glucosamine-1-phosphate N-acetyltransferase GlmU [Amphritea sp. 2_MG-2023]|uniref:bifunctional UDP-N-acetylglucosamine diphosphorylase/glucosamine-1-phosphate N-acetyltransferase GlmU n=1 Tax=Amphritea TaxID=515417 RepID=UPI001C07792F|nr:MULTISPECIES: bifunctional UDP-N-acetylglucosamine diphosphorylase/glucosamine-1-phosphate N-acetyltransferase GlmU [Amphritea]MBU2967690.1 bifunctional UDP-N-acetylglucosamine diphosphorylase/glucosamine-1-phosphate N-acetyltransferase GlmU [Amphritea atlantica]MDO6416993.1 bifunctional UDP-N-acetylglucosamine diphosphorylase/glucosamine-1-phosphate N-acetyltransferase GlmU [Amphritea sp. 2_MG-2023]
MNTLDIVILAAGQGSRMKSSLPKVLHSIGGKSMLQRVIDNSRSLDNANIHVVVGHGAEHVKTALSGQNVQFALQAEQLGTGHAVAQAMPNIADDGVVLVLYGDVPLTQTETMAELVKIAERGQFGLLTVNLDDPTGYGRIMRSDAGDVVAIVEHKDASEAQRAICEVNTGILALPAQLLSDWIPQLSSNNAQGEYYLTDIIAMAAEQGVRIQAIQPATEQEVQGVNNRLQQAELERWYQRRQAEALMLEGVSLADPARLDVRGEVSVGHDVAIDINVILEGKVTIGDNVTIEANCIIKDSIIGSGSHIKANSILEQAVVADHCDIGPFARLRPGSQLASHAKIGNFVETKKAFIGEGSKVSHLSYIGDAQIGAEVNVGAGTITCNYDGVNKSITEIGDGAFIGSNSALVAPVKIGAGATVGAGSTITKTVEAEQLALTRAKQTNLNNWQRPVKKS